jgi:GLPGLI family protein
VGKFFVILFFICFSLKSVSQNFQSTYKIIEFKEQVYSDKLSPKKLEMNKSNFKELIKFCNNFELLVTCNSNNYFFYIPEKLDSDNYSNPYLRLLYLGYLGLDEAFYYDNSHHYYTNNMESFVTKSKNDIISWEINNDVVIISGYKCYSATPSINSKNELGYSVKNLKVWFTNEINIKGGPTRFGNLPGLIVALENSYVRFELTELEETNKKIPTLDEFLNKKTIQTFEETNSYYKKLRENVINN